MTSAVFKRLPTTRPGTPPRSPRGGSPRPLRPPVLTRKPHPLELHTLIDKAAIRRRLRGTAAWREQWDHLLTMSEAENITIQALPLAAGAYETMVGQLLILSSPGAEQRGPSRNNPEGASPCR
ncbi:Scr1 family TA system antitoxin-like transcriptional regulator [Actinokineospora sp. PR83]|uniref:Scr1 family TA system antitoxin-like transcriptional regulator n=1 Tax=Actinokineospora sp. PR83 TaxID=2884908 RepID=UPI0035ABC9BD